MPHIPDVAPEEVTFWGILGYIATGLGILALFWLGAG